MKKVAQLKASVSNAVHKIVNPQYNLPTSKRKRVEVSNEEKIARYDAIAALDAEISNRISTAKYTKRSLRRKYEKMLAEGKQPKQKTTLVQWIAMQKEKETVPVTA